MACALLLVRLVCNFCKFYFQLPAFFLPQKSKSSEANKGLYTDTPLGTGLWKKYQRISEDLGLNLALRGRQTRSRTLNI